MNPLTTLQVNLKERSYPIIIGSSLDNPINLTEYLSNQQVCLISNQTVYSLYGDYCKRCFPNTDILYCEIPDSESAKSLPEAGSIFEQLITAQFSRQCTIVALGGGVVGDLAGFVAASWQRGVGFIQMPTTLLAQVDSSVGGKTGVNLPQGKNMVGAFHQPLSVISNLSTLQTLPLRELSAGLAEIIKYGLIWDESFFNWLEQNINALLNKDIDAISQAIQISCQIKAEVVSQDEKESGIRAWLNLGHTFGHAIEASMGYGKWLHGEAISVGMVMATDLSIRQGCLDPSVLPRVIALFKAAKLPIQGPATMSVKNYIQKMSIDKKVVNHEIRLVLLKRIGEAFVSANHSSSELASVIQTHSGN